MEFKKPSVVFLIPDFRIGGAERVTVSLANYLHINNYRVTFVVLKNHGAFLSDLSAGIRVIDLNVSRLRYIIAPLTKILNNTKPDVLFAVMWPLSSIAVFVRLVARLRVRIAVVDQISMAEEISRALKLPMRLYNFIAKVTYRLADAIIVPSSQMKEDIKTLIALSDAKLVHIPNPASIPSEQVKTQYTSPYQIELGVTDPSVKRILAIGTLKPQKNHKMLIDAFHLGFKFDNVILVIIGDGDLREELQVQINTLELQSSVFLPGSKININPWLQHADLFVLSSDWEGLPTVLINALDYELPIVSTDCKSGPSEILELGAFGKLIRPGDTVGLANAMKLCLKEGKKGDYRLSERAKEFSIERVGPQYEAMIARMMQ